MILEQACARGKVVIVLDGMNQLDESHYAHAMHWLPQTLPHELRLIVSTIEGDCLNALRSRNPAPREIVIGALELEHRKEIVRQTLGGFRKRLDEEARDERYGNTQIGLLLEKIESDIPLYLVVACEELRVFGEFERVTERIASLPHTVEELFEQVLERLERDHGRELVESALSLLDCSRHGLLESEMLELLRRGEEDQLPPGIWAPLFRSLKFYLRPPGESGEGALDFFHRQLARAARKRYLENEEQKIAVHSRLAETFSRKVDPTGDRQWSGNYPRGLSELPYHLREAQLFEGLFRTARDESFLSAQIASFADEPRLHLETIQEAITGAIRSDNAAAMSEFVLSHARRVLEAGLESPLRVVRTGNLERAWKLAELCEIERCELWHLLLAWELSDSGKTDDARETLKRVLQKQLVHLEEWRPEVIARLLIPVFDLDPDAFLELVSTTDTHHILVDHFVARNEVGAAFEVARRIDDKSGLAKAFIGIAESQARAGEVGAARSTFAEALAAARQNSSEWNKPGVLRKIAAAQAGVGETSAARETFSEALEAAQHIGDPRGRSVAIREIAVAQIEAGESTSARDSFAQSIATARQIASDSEKASEMRSIAGAQARAGQVSEAVEAARQITHQGNRAAALSEIGTAGACAGQLSEALAAAQEIDNPIYKTAVLREIAVARMHAGETAAARDAFSTAVAVAEGIEREVSRAAALKEIAAAHAQAGDVAAARDTFSQALGAARLIREPGDRAESLQWIATAQAEAGEETAARETFADALASTRQVEHHQTRGWRVMEIATAQLRVGQVDEALASSRQVADSEYRSLALEQIAVAEAEAGELAAARETFANAIAVAQQIPYGGDKASRLGTVVSAQAKAGQFSDAYEAARAIEHRETRVETLSKIAATQARAGQFAGALAAARQLAAGERKAETLSAIATAQIEAGETSSVRDTLAEALVANQETEDVQGRAHALREIAAAQARIRELDGARATFIEAVTSAQRIESLGDRATVLSDIATAQSLSGETTLARDTFVKGLSAARQIGDEQQRMAILKGIASQQANAGQVESARETLMEALDAARRIASDWSRPQAIAGIAVALARAGQFSDAYALAGQIDNLTFRARALGDLAAHSEARGVTALRSAFAEAVTAAQLISDELNRAQALCHLAVEQAKAGMFSEAFAAAEQIEPQGLREWALKDIAAAQAPSVDPPAVPDTSPESLAVVRQIQDPGERARALSLFGEAQAAAGERAAAHDTFAEAFRVAEQISTDGSKAEALKRIAVAQANAGFKEALQTATLINTNRDSILPEIARALAHAEDREGFKGLLIPCAQYLSAAYCACGLVAQLYPEQATAVAAVVSLGSDGGTLAPPEPSAPETASRGLTPQPHPGADPLRAYRLNLEYQQNLAQWKALQWWRRLMVKRPERPTGI